MQTKFHSEVAMPRPDFIQAPTLKQYVASFNVWRFGRDIVAEGELTPERAVAFRHLLNVMANEYGLNDNDTGGQAVREAINPDMGAGL
jgi:hypothetical protein